MKTLEEDAKYKNNNNFKPTFPLNVPRHDINLCKVMQVQAKSMKANWLSTCVKVGVHMKCFGDNKCLANSEELTTLVTLAIDKA